MSANNFDIGWTIHEEISSSLQLVFNQAMGSLVGVSYEPKLAATKVTRGTSYCFICISTLIVPGSPQGLAKILIYQGPNEKPILVDIENLL